MDGPSLDWRETRVGWTHTKNYEADLCYRRPEGLSEKREVWWTFSSPKSIYRDLCHLQVLIPLGVAINVRSSLGSLSGRWSVIRLAIKSNYKRSKYQRWTTQLEVLCTTSRLLLLWLLGPLCLPFCNLLKGRKLYLRLLMTFRLLSLPLSSPHRAFRRQRFF